MTTYGVTSTGFVLKRLSDIIADTKSSLSTVTDTVTGESLTPDLLDEDDPLINIVNSLCDNLAELWEIAQESYNQFDPLKNSGAGQSGTVQLNGLTRSAGSYSQVAVTVTGSPGLAVPAGKQITTVNDIPVFELPAFTIGESGTEIVVATCTEKGPYMAYAGELVKIITPSSFTSVVNSLDSTAGSFEETDTELRARQQVSTSRPAHTIIESIAAALLDLDDVTYARTYHNFTLAEDERGIPAKSVALVVLGGDDDEIADVLFERTAIGGAGTYGSTTVTVYDINGIDYDMNFTRPTEKAITVEIEIEITNARLYPDNGAETIKSAILQWAAAGAVSIGETSMTHTGYSPGRDVLASELYAPIYNAVGGIHVVSVEVSADGDVGPASVTIDWDEIATFDSDDITIGGEESS